MFVSHKSIYAFYMHLDREMTVGSELTLPLNIVTMCSYSLRVEAQTILLVDLSSGYSEVLEIRCSSAAHAAPDL